MEEIWDSYDCEVEDSPATRLTFSGRSFELVAEEDVDWSYYIDFLYPDDETLRWMLDRRIDQTLELAGDTLEAPRRVDHWIYFFIDEDRASFAEIATSDGFNVSLLDPEDEASPGGLQLHRVDSVKLQDIHKVALALDEKACEHDGAYDGWATTVIQ